MQENKNIMPLHSQVIRTFLKPFEISLQKKDFKLVCFVIFTFFGLLK